MTDNKNTAKWVPPALWKLFKELQLEGAKKAGAPMSLVEASLAMAEQAAPDDDIFDTNTVRGMLKAVAKRNKMAISWTESQDAAGKLAWTVNVTRPDGAILTFTEENTPKDEKGHNSLRRAIIAVLVDIESNPVVNVEA